MPDFEQIIKGIKAILQLIFGKDVPPWVFPVTEIKICAPLGNEPDTFDISNRLGLT